ncbi:hypothetical protein P3T76_005050 [Phytophthora citrophthora]|uniref:RxLR effector protein n=1 Tax=Phytophthora citrophthora TaxID=4793 RepID=A0AAD9GSA1_9STRA|nr:hypothetical protein P3T76_005050 [Phytophthora citrophthora]
MRFSFVFVVVIVMFHHVTGDALPTNTVPTRETITHDDIVGATNVSDGRRLRSHTDKEERSTNAGTSALLKNWLSTGKAATESIRGKL